MFSQFSVKIESFGIVSKTTCRLYMIRDNLNIFLHNQKPVLLGGEAVTTPTFQLESVGSTPGRDI